MVGRVGEVGGVSVVVAELVRGRGMESGGVRGWVVDVVCGVG